MNRVYAGAEGVNVYLGEEEESDSRAFKLIHDAFGGYAHKLRMEGRKPA